MNWDEEFEKCKGSMKYFYANYFIIDGKKPTMTELDEHLFKVYDELLIRIKKLEQETALVHHIRTFTTRLKTNLIIVQTNIPITNDKNKDNSTL
jgi:hypothetical protein